MKNRGNSDREIIIKRRSKKQSHDGHGSSAWKVAFADFTLAMMALFMVLWIINPKIEEKPVTPPSLAANPLVDGGAGIFDNSSRTPLEFEVLAPRDVPMLPGRQRQSQEQPVEGQGNRQLETPADIQELVSLLNIMAGEVDAIANVEIQAVPQGLRVLIKDDQQRMMFQRGSATLNAHFKRVLEGLSKVLATVDNKLIVSGHTDATPYRHRNGYNNWNLSGDRALRARNVMVDAGLPASGILQVTAQADVMLLHPEEPSHAANRRIEILLLTRHAENLYRELFGESHARADYSARGAQYMAPPQQAPASL